LIRLAAYTLAPLALLITLAAGASILDNGLLRLTGDILPLHKIISKTTLILLILSVFPLKKRLNLSWTDLGFTPRAIFFRQVWQGLLLGVITLLPVLLTLYLLDVHVWDNTRNWTAGKFLEKVGLGLFFALLIAVGEEMLFRGLLLSSFRRKMPLGIATTFCSLYFAALHFLKSSSHIAYADLQWNSGFQLMLEAFANWLNPAILSALVSLFVVGVFLALLRSRVPQSLGLCIGCHAGWVWQIKISRDLFNVNLQADNLYLVNTYYDGVIGPLVSVWLTLAILGFCLLNLTVARRNCVAV
jgi:membrane protease YdiL (CAAX protease family)